MSKNLHLFDMSTQTKIIFLSDIHLGIDHQNALPNRKARLIECLLEWKNEISHLFLVGDVFEFWMEYADFIPKGDFDFLATLRDLQISGVEIHYFAGNHDFNLGQFFQNQVGLHVHQNEYKVSLQGRDILLLHGDGMAASDKLYRVVKSIITHKLSNFLFKLIHPDWGMALARFIGSTSRAQHKYGHVKWQEYYDAAIDIMVKNNAKVCINGHIHEAHYQELKDHEDNEGYLYLNSGQWFHDPSWIELESGEFTIKFLDGHVGPKVY